MKVQNSLSKYHQTRFMNHAGTQTWFANKAAANGVAEISLMDEIGGWGISARAVVNFIKSLSEGTKIKMHIYSPGGDVMEGNEIYNALKGHKGEVDVTLGALCGSIATVIACAGTKVSMAKNGLFFIHNPFCFAMGDSEHLRYLAGVMDKMRTNIIATYAERTKGDPEALGKAMDAETWYTAEEAVAAGFADQVIDADDEDPEDVKNRFQLDRFKNFTTAFSKLPKKERQPSDSGERVPAPPKEGSEKPPVNNKTETKPQYPDMIRSYNAGARIFASLLPFAALSGMRFDKDDGPAGGGSIANSEEFKAEVAKQAKELMAAKLKRDAEIDEITLKIRNRDKKDFSALASRFKAEDKTVEEFTRSIALSDEFKPVAGVDEQGGGSGIEVLGIQGLPVGSPGEVFVASQNYKDVADRVRRGSRQNAAVMAETRGYMQAALAAVLPGLFRNVSTTTGLTSIEKLPGVVTLGVRPLTVKDLLAAGATNNTTIRYIREVSFTNAATTVAEGAAKPQASFSLEEIDANVKKIAVYTKVTDELFADFLAVASYINMRLPYMVERTEEDQLLNGDGTGQNLTGLLQTSGIQTLAVGADTVVDAIYKAFTKVRWGNLAGTAQGGFEPDGIVMHPTDWEAIRLSKDANEQYYGGGPFTGAYGNGQGVSFEMLWNKPVVVTPAITENTVLVGAFKLAAQYFQRQGLTIESTNTDQDDFIKNLMTIRAESRLALAVYRPAAFCTVTGA